MTKYLELFKIKLDNYSKIQLNALKLLSYQFKYLKIFKFKKFKDKIMVLDSQKFFRQDKEEKSLIF